jgi:hypothetical protein
MPRASDFSPADIRRLERLRDKATRAHVEYLDAVTNYSTAVHVIDLRIRRAKVRAHYRALRQVKALWVSN